MDRLRLGVIGTGSVVREIYRHLYFASDYSKLVSVEAICDINEAGMNEFGDAWNIPADRRFTDYRDMVRKVSLDAAAVNTPDALHRDPTVFALENGLDVLLAKPLASTVRDAADMIEAARRNNRLLGVDFHKRDDPKIKEAGTRYAAGDYGSFQSSVWYMLDKLMIADPNFEPRFFATADFAAQNTPVSFLTVHMADAFMKITGLKPESVKAMGYKQKLPSLKPIPVDGYDLTDTEIIFENGGICHIITGWAVPNSAYANTVQSARIIGSEGVLDLGLDRSGYCELLRDGIFERNPLFMNHEPDGTVCGYGISCPGKILQNILKFRNNSLEKPAKDKLYCPFESGFYTTLICEAAHVSLETGCKRENGVTCGARIDLKDFLKEKLGSLSLW